MWQKQSSLWFQAVTAQTTLHNNIFYNGPRAAFNFNDGFGGGDDIAGNLLLNCVRESSDHGPWNSWSRTSPHPALFMLDGSAAMRCKADGRAVRPCSSGLAVAPLLRRTCSVHNRDGCFL